MATFAVLIEGTPVPQVAHAPSAIESAGPASGLGGGSGGSGSFFVIAGLVTFFGFLDGAPLKEAKHSHTSWSGMVL